jgi:hypothetical protein
MRIPTNFCMIIPTNLCRRIPTNFCMIIPTNLGRCKSNYHTIMTMSKPYT